MNASPLRPTLLVVSIAVTAAACAGRPKAKEPGWYEIARAPGIVAYLDTARLERLGGGRARVWFRFEYLEPFTASNDTSVHYQASETRQELDCVTRRTRGLELRMQATGGVAVGVPAPDTIAQSIDTHPLNSGIFLVTCRTIGHPIPPRSGT